MPFKHVKWRMGLLLNLLQYKLMKEEVVNTSVCSISIALLQFFLGWTLCSIVINEKE